MSEPNAVLPSVPADEPVPQAQAPDLVTLLVAAAQVAAANDLDPDAFIRAARMAYFDARPALREQLADKRLKRELRELRKRGLVGSA